MPEVRCQVDNCVFWKEGDYCTASEIWVKDSVEESLFELGNFELGEDLESGYEQADAFTSAQTYCETMRPKKG